MRSAAVNLSKPVEARMKSGSTLHVTPGGVNTIAAIKIESGRTLWTNRSSPGPYTSVALGEHAIAGTAVNGVLYRLIVNRNAVVALDEATGKELWRVHTVAPVKMSLMVTLGRVVFGDTTGVLYRVDRKSGDVLHYVFVQGAVLHFAAYHYW